MDSGTIKWFSLFLGVLGLCACVLYLVEKDYGFSLWFAVLFTIYLFANSIIHFIKDAPYKGDKDSKVNKDANTK